MKSSRWVAGMALALLVLSAKGQAPMSDSPGRSITGGAAVVYQYPEQVTVSAGKPSPVALHFRIGQGLHINSHTPRQEELCLLYTSPGGPYQPDLQRHYCSFCQAFTR